jgi:hypothetical protein
MYIHVSKSKNDKIKERKKKKKKTVKQHRMGGKGKEVQ